MHYNPDNGLFTRAVALRKGCHVGKPVGSPRTVKDCSSRTYINIDVDGKTYSAHRLAVFYMTGEWPKGVVDHKNHNGADNRWNNLREATVSQNAQNKRAKRANTSGLKGVSWCRQTQKWKASIFADGRSRTIGRFADKNDAHLAYRTKAQEAFGAFACFRGPQPVEQHHG